MFDTIRLATPRRELHFRVTHSTVTDTSCFIIRRQTLCKKNTHTDFCLEVPSISRNIPDIGITESHGSPLGGRRPAAAEATTAVQTRRSTEVSV
jgi:hypothetical protein